MKYLSLLSPVALAIAVAVGCAAPSAVLAASGTEANPVVPPWQSVEGRTQMDWSRAWWQWASSFESDVSPLTDRTGSRCEAGQSGAVWFLAGSSYGSRRVERTCTVPAGRYLFFPLVNTIALDVNDIGCPYLLRHVEKQMSDPMALDVEVDGRKLPASAVRHLKSESCFKAGGELAASDGYYVMLRPLPAGQHVIKFGGEVEASAQSVTYTITVR
jgi:hypothetical protein